VCESDRIINKNQYNTPGCYTIDLKLRHNTTLKYITNSMEQRPSWETNSRLAGKEAPPLHLWNPKLNYFVHKSQPSFPILSQINPVHNPRSLFPENSFLYYPSVYAWSSDWSLSFRLSNQNFLPIPHLFMCATCPAHPILLDLIILIVLGEEFKIVKLLTM
jgi:hypothetical protein